MKRIYTVLAASTILFAACGNGSESSSGSDTSEVHPLDTTTNATDKAMNYSPNEKAGDNPPADSAAGDSMRADSIK